MSNKNTPEPKAAISDLASKKRAGPTAQNSNPPTDSVDAALERSRKLNDELEALVHELREVAQQRGLPV